MLKTSALDPYIVTCFATSSNLFVLFRATGGRFLTSLNLLEIRKKDNPYHHTFDTNISHTFDAYCNQEFEVFLSCKMIDIYLKEKETQGKDY